MAHGRNYVIASNTNYEANSSRWNQRLEGPVPWLAFEEDDQVDPAGRFRIVVTGDTLILQRAATADFASFSNVIELVGSDLTTRIAAILEITGGQVIKSTSATEIGIQVTNAALTPGTLGSIILPVKTDANAPNDAEGGNLNGAIVYNSNDQTLEVRDGVDSYVSVMLAGYGIQRHVPELPDGLYHRRQHLADGKVDETLCAICGDQMRPGDQVVMFANGWFRDNDLHCVFAHSHHVADGPQFQAILEGVEQLRGEIERINTQLAPPESD